MAKVTSKLQVTLPKALADKLGIHPGDEILWQDAKDCIRIVPKRGQKPLDMKARLALFDQSTVRQIALQAQKKHARSNPLVAKRGWTREDLYERSFPD
ncbi:MAG: AbrB/MazE/SpoVT family DNA-binding domain-containing protein [candidate division Zixibacteria bacterium]|nr:AbrB/MazE/SpoVT family DNA-binding domain-containing protein [candidate division Zixibacteria bacterium]